MSEQLLTIKQVLEKIPVSRVTLWELRKRGDFPQPARTLGRKVLFRLADVDNWIRNQTGGNQ